MEYNYELEKLGWKAFQDLCQTILGEVWGKDIQEFASSYDGGRDGSFIGEWVDNDGVKYKGSFVLQCKFTSETNKIIKINDLNDEVEKAKKLASKGLCNNYFLLSNAKLTGKNEELIKEKFENITGVKSFKAYGKEWISKRIVESSTLRMLVPRVYGLGDLTQILDQRAYAQANHILYSLGDDLSKFVITDAFRNSARAILKHSFVLLLGEPACGKSTIAASLSVGALDKWGCSIIKIVNPDDFVKHWNPEEPKQLFWVDDAFGATQVDWRKTMEWNAAFPHINAALNKGVKIIFTSRDYIYKAAKDSLKESAFPLIKKSQVIINVQDLSKKEKQQILYNHIKLGNQKKKYKEDIKPYLIDVAESKAFTPESARRLGNKMFTEKLNINKFSVLNFVEKQKELLIEVITNLDECSKSTLALMFMRGGSVSRPVDISKKEEKSIESMGGNVHAVKRSFKTLEGSLVGQSLDDDVYYWRFRHPTVRDAFAEYISSDIDLMDIYLSGCPLTTMFEEVSCGLKNIKGVKIVIPESRYQLLISRIKNENLNHYSLRLSLMRFLSRKCDKKFLVALKKDCVELFNSLNVYSYLSNCSELEFIAKLNDLKLLDEEKRSSIVSSITELACITPDAGYADSDAAKILNDAEIEEINELVKEKVIYRLDQLIDHWHDNYEGQDPEDYFFELEYELNRFKEIFCEELELVEKIEKALIDINNLIDDLRYEYESNWDVDDISENVITKESGVQRSIFDDVDM